MGKNNTFEKDPAAVLDYQVDWSRWLGADTLATSTWTVPTGLTQAGASNSSTTATIWLSGGTAGVTYTLVNHITTAGGRAEDRAVYIVVKER